MMRSRGFTVLELLVAISVATILLTIGIPSFRNIIAENRRISYVSEVFTALNYARSEAIARNVNVVICKSSNALACDSSADWADGWLIYANLSSSGSDDYGDGEPDASDIPLLSNDGLKNYDLSSSEYGDRLIYLATGRASQTGQFELCSDDDWIEGRIIRINAAGRATTPIQSTPGCGAAGG